MNKPIHFDVLIVYNGKLATSASDDSVSASTPFPLNSNNHAYNAVYAYFLDICHKFGLKAAFTTSRILVPTATPKMFF